MRSSRRIAVGCLVAALGAGAWWMAVRGGDAPAAGEASGAEDVASRPGARDGVDATPHGGGELAGAAPAPVPVDGDDASDVVVLVTGPDAPLRGAQVRLTEYVKEDDRVDGAEIDDEAPAASRRSRRFVGRGQRWILGPERLGSADATGRCRFANVRSEWSEVSASAPGFLRGGRRLDRRAPGGATEIRVSLLPATRIEGSIVEAGTGAPIVGAKVVFGLADGISGGRYGDAFVDDTQSVGPDGRFVLWAPKDVAVLRLEVSAEEHAGVAFEVRGWRGHLDPERPVIRMPRLGAIGGVVLDPDGRPLPSATISISEVEVVAPASDAAGIGSIGDATGGKVGPPTGADGVYGFAGLAQGGRFRLRATAEGYPPFEREVTLEFGATAVRADLRFAPAAAIAVRVLGSDERPFASTVTIDVTSAGVRQRRDAWRADGRHLFDRVAGGAVHVRVESPSGAHEEKVVAAQAGTVAEVTVRLRAGSPIRGEVVDAAGRRISAARVHGGGRTATTDADGRFELTELAPGEHALAATAVGDDRREFRTTGSVAARAPSDGVRLVVHRLAHVRLRLAGADPTAVPGQVHFCLCEPGAHPSRGSNSWGEGRRVGVGYEFLPGVAVGAYELILAPSGFAPSRLPMTFRSGEDLDLGVVRLGSGIALSGRVLDVEGAPLPGASVAVLDGRSKARTDAAGTFELSHVAPGPVILGVEVGGAPVVRVTVEAADGGAPCEIRMSGPGLVRGALRGADGRPRSGVRIRFVRTDDAQAPSVDATSSRLGRVFAVLPAGTWDATFTPSGGGSSVLATVKVASDAVATLDLTLPND